MQADGKHGGRDAGTAMRRTTMRAPPLLPSAGALWLGRWTSALMRQLEEALDPPISEGIRGRLHFAVTDGVARCRAKNAIRLLQETDGVAGAGSLRHGSPWMFLC
jgi:hypothetical protein